MAISLFTSSDNPTMGNFNSKFTEANSSFYYPNLLINTNFKNAVNQRGQASYSGTGYTIDRWTDLSSSGTVTLSTNGITLTSSASYARWNQIFDSALASYLSGKTVTFSMSIKGSYAFYLSQYSDQSTPLGYIEGTAADFEVVSVTVTLEDALNYLRVELRNGIGSSCEIKYVKLELGSIATPFVPSPYGEELVLCQRYYQIRSVNNIAAVDMRPLMCLASPTITAVTGGYAYDAEI